MIEVTIRRPGDPRHGQRGRLAEEQVDHVMGWITVEFDDPELERQLGAKPVRFYPGSAIKLAPGRTLADRERQLRACALLARWLFAPSEQPAREHASTSLLVRVLDGLTDPLSDHAELAEQETRRLGAAR